jgi:outer membrane receptor for ferrienterochelin and colicins
MKYIIMLCCAILCMAKAGGQTAFKIKIADSANNEPLVGVTIVEAGKPKGITDINGLATVDLGTGNHCVSVTYVGYITKTVTLTTPGLTTILLVADNTALEEMTIVASTRGKQNIESSPLKVEVLGKEELGEEAGIKPGNIASILGDVSGVQIQQSSPNTGNSNVRIQGLPGRYTQVVRDGMPLYDNFSGGLGILSIPPLDLRQIELIKGSASTIYGGGAIAGLINLLSRKPSLEQEGDVLVNYSTLSEFNINGFAARRYKKAGYTMFAGYTQQSARDVNGDGFSDVPRLRTINVHPKVFLYPTDKTIISIGYSLTADDRAGGDMRAIPNNNRLYYFEGLTGTRNLAEYSMDHFFKHDVKLTVKGLYSYATKDMAYTTYSLSARQHNYYNEASVYKPFKHAELVAGINVTGDKYSAPATDSVLIHDRTNNTIGVFAQFTWHPGEKTTYEAGMRIDRHDNYGYFPLPRLALFHHINAHFGLRAGFGMGYKIPDPFAAQDVEIDQRYIEPVGAGVKAEHSYGANLEGNYKQEWDKEHTLFINHAFFYTKVTDPLYLVSSLTGNTVYLTNWSSPTTTAGFDTYLKLLLKKWELYGGYTFTDARNTIYNTGFVPLTPRHRAACVVAWEPEEEWRLGLEGSYTGPQYRYTGSQTPGYTFIALMVQRKLGRHLYIVANCENLLDYRMSRVESLYEGSMANPQFKPIWAPIDGRVINVSVRWKL